MGKLVSGRDRLHTDFAEQLLVVVRPGAANKEHRELAFAPRANVALDFFNRLHFLGDNLLDALG